jgi:hypothetical protein
VPIRKMTPCQKPLDEAATSGLLPQEYNIRTKVILQSYYMLSFHPIDYPN